MIGSTYKPVVDYGFVIRTRMVGILLRVVENYGVLCCCKDLDRGGGDEAG